MISALAISLHHHEHRKAHLAGASSYELGIYPAQFGANSSPRRRRVSPLAILLPAYRGTRQSVRSLNRANGLRLHTFEHQPPVKLIAAAPLSHHQILSSAASSSGFKTTWKAFADGQNLFARASKND